MFMTDIVWQKTLEQMAVCCAAGPRVCAGKGISMDLLFLLFASLLQRFELQKGCDCEINKCFEGQYNFTFSPVPFKIKLRVHC